MNFLTEKLYKWQLSKILSKPCGSFNPRNLDNFDKIDCFVVVLDKGSKPYFHAKGIKGNNIIGRTWNGSSYTEEGSLPILALDAYDLVVTHYHSYNQTRYNGIYDFFINRITRWPYIKVRLDVAGQHFFNKKKLFTKQRIDLLKFMINDQLERNHSGISTLDLMTKLYSIKWVLHPEGDAQEKKLELYLDALTKSGDLEKINHEYVVTGKAISSIEKFEEEERRHTENVKIQKRILYLTIIITFLTLVQAGLIKMSPVLDFTNKAMIKTETDSRKVDQSQPQETFNDQLQNWEQEINSQLKKGRSGIYGDPKLVHSIGLQAHLHEDILFQKLKTNMFVYELLDASTPLLKKYNMTPFKGGSIQDQQQKWLNAYRKRK